MILFKTHSLSFYLKKEEQGEGFFKRCAKQYRCKRKEKKGEKQCKRIAFVVQEHCFSILKAMLFHNKNTAFSLSNHPTKNLYLSRRTQKQPLHRTRTASFNRLFIIKSTFIPLPFLFNLSPSTFTKATLLLPPSPFSPSFFTLHKKK